MAKKNKTADEKRWMTKVAELDCAVCGNPYVELHHLTGAGMGLKSSNYEIIPLCYIHHRGAEGIHTIGKKTWQNKYGFERELLEKTRLYINTLK